jgi:hypothetical protein
MAQMGEVEVGLAPEAAKEAEQPLLLSLVSDHPTIINSCDPPSTSN